MKNFLIGFYTAYFVSFLCYGALKGIQYSRRCDCE